MSNYVLIGILLVVMAMAYQLGLTRSRKIVASGTVRMHSRPTYYGLLVALWCGIPAFLVFILWNVFEPEIVRTMISGHLPADILNGNEQVFGGAMQRIQTIASGFGVSGEPKAYELAAAEHMNSLKSTARLALVGVVFALALAGILFSWSRISPVLRARNHVEKFVGFVLILCSTIAILTTVGIVMSMLNEAIRFFSFVSPVDFFFGLTWNPNYTTVATDQSGQFGLLPLLWGTLMISLIALAVSVPLGLMTAIYLAEYAPTWLRSFAKPVIEVLAGIPTIVYGFFALIVVGPFFYKIGLSLGVDIKATSALTAGVVMGIMIIPFVSSLSDDIITQVPRAMRDGSLGLGATKSETVLKVVLPAALPGIVGAFLLAASRAIGETMIVVLAAGNSPVLHANPFQAVSTVTVTIVNQLTGDQDFASPQSLVAFALGLTLFLVTLILNVGALHIVRKYREQYE